jgi:hypothetical protein
MRATDFRLHGFVLSELIFTPAQMETFSAILTPKGAKDNGYGVVCIFLPLFGNLEPEWRAFADGISSDGNRFAAYYARPAPGALTRCEQQYRLACGMSTAMWGAGFAINPMPETLWTAFAKPTGRSYTQSDNLLLAIWVRDACADKSPVLFAYLCHVRKTAKNKPKCNDDAEIAARWLRLKQPKKRRVIWKRYDDCVKLHGHIMAYRKFMRKTYSCTLRTGYTTTRTDEMFLRLYDTQKASAQLMADHLGLRTIEEHFMVTQGVDAGLMERALGEHHSFFRATLIVCAMPAVRNEDTIDGHPLMCCVETVPSRVMKKARVELE